MKNEEQLKLFMVSNSKPFTNFEDHEAALHIYLHELVERAIEEKEDPIILIQDYLHITYTSDETVEGLANFLYHTGAMGMARQVLQEHWSVLDTSLPEDSLMYGGVSKEEALQLYSEVTLRSYLEALAGL